MYKYIGIRGHRGSGKSSISYLLGCALENLTKNSGVYDSNIDDEYYDCVNHIKRQETINFNRIQFESFADTPITMVNLIFGVPIEYCYNDEKKDSVYINLRTFEQTEEKPTKNLYTAKEYFEQRCNEIDTELNPHKMKEDIYMSIRELIYYYGNYVIKFFFGANTWIKSLKSSTIDIDLFFNREDDIVWKIYTDVKFTSEVDYILEKSGIIMNLSRPDHKKDNFDSSTNLAFDNRINYNIDYEDISDYNTKEQIKQIALQIYENK